MSIPANLKDIVAFLFKYENGDYRPIGTGFHTVVRESDCVFNYLITCKHVILPIVEEGDQIFTRLNRSDRMDVDHPPLEGDWVLHEDDAIDLAVLPMRPGGEPFYLGAMSIESVLTNQVSERLGHSLGEGDPIFFIGLFEPYRGYRRNIPVVRFGNIAMVTDEKIPGKYGPAHYHIIEGQVFPYNSGSPVFSWLLVNNRLTYYIIGVACAFYPEKEQIWRDAMPATLFTHFGISLAVPATRIHEILYGETLVGLRKEKKFAGRMSSKPEPAIGNHERNS